MRYLGKEYDGEGVTVAVIDSGVNPDDPRLEGAKIDGWSIVPHIAKALAGAGGRHIDFASIAQHQFNPIIFR